MKKLCKLLCISIMLLPCTIKASESDKADYVPLDVTVPTKTSITFNEDGSNTYPSNFIITNNSSVGGIQLSNIHVTSKTGWQLQDGIYDKNSIIANSKNIQLAIGKNEDLLKSLAIGSNSIDALEIGTDSALKLIFEVNRAAYSFDKKEEAYQLAITIKWIKDPVIVTFDSNSDINFDDLITIQDTLDLSKYQPIKHEHVFLGWVDKAHPDDVLPNIINLDRFYDLEAKWQINRYTTHFDTAGGSTVLDMTEDYGTTIDLNTVKTEREGYTFEGWYDENGVKQEAYVVGKESILTAKWIANEYTLSFDAQGGLDVSDIDVTYDQEYTLPLPTKTGHIFEGWYTAPNGAGDKIDNGIYQVASDQQLYAKWTIAKHTISFDTAGGSKLNTITNDYGCVINLDAYVPSKTGYTFKGWYIGSTHVSGNYTLQSDVTLTAKWLANKYTLSFDAQGGSDVSDIDVMYDATLGTLLPSTKAGWFFNGWYTAPSGGTLLSNMSIYQTAGNTIAYARWSNQAPVFTSIPPINVSLDRVLNEDNWYEVYRNMIITDREDGVLTSSNKYNDISFSSDTAKGLWNNLYVSKITAFDGSVHGNGITNVAGTQLKFLQAKGTGTYEFMYRCADRVGAITYKTRRITFY